MLIFDPTQLKSFGHEYYETETFSVRYVLTKKLIFKSIYIPYGPIIKNESGINDFFKFIIENKFNKVKIDLPKIYIKDIEVKFVSLLKENGFKSSGYIQDSETLLLSPSTWELKDRYQRYVRSSSKDFNVKIFTNLDENIIDEKTSKPLLKLLYDIYFNNGKLLNYNVKPFETFKDTFSNSITSVAYSNLNDSVCGFVMGYVYDNKVIDNFNKSELLLLFTALSEEGKEHKLGYLIHQRLFEYVFNELKFDSIDFHGADRSKGRSYIEFKERFGGTFVSYPASFECKKYF